MKSTRSFSDRKWEIGQDYGEIGSFLTIRNTYLEFKLFFELFTTFSYILFYVVLFRVKYEVRSCLVIKEVRLFSAVF